MIPLAIKELNALNTVAINVESEIKITRELLHLISNKIEYDTTYN